MSENLTISSAVNTFVAKVKAMGGNKNFIDSKKEYNKLSGYLNGAENPLNEKEKSFVKGLMIEYENKYINPEAYATSAMTAVNRFDDDINKAEFDALFGTADAAGDVNAHNIIEVLAAIPDLSEFVDGVEDQDSNVNKTSMLRIVDLISERVEILVDKKLLADDGSRYLKVVEALEYLRNTLNSEFPEESVSNVLSFIVNLLNGVHTDGDVSLVPGSGDAKSIASEVLSLFDGVGNFDDDVNKENFDKWFGDGTMENPGYVSATNIVEVLDNIGTEMQEFIEDIEDQDSGDNIDSMKRIVTLLNERLDILVENGTLKENSSKYTAIDEGIENINNYIKAGFDGNEKSIADELLKLVLLFKGVGQKGNSYKSTPVDELIQRAMDAVGSWDDDTNKEEFDYLFGTGALTENTPINYVNIVDVLTSMDDIVDFVEGIEEQDDGDDKASLQRIVDLLKEHLQLLISAGKVNKNDRFVERIEDKLSDIEMYKSEFGGSIKSIANLLFSLSSELKAKNK